MKTLSKILAVFCLAVLSVLPLQAAQEESVSWSVTTLDGKTITSETYKDSLQLLVFYRGKMHDDGSAWCPNSSGTVQSFAECDWAGTKGVKVLLIEADGSSKAQTEKFVNAFGGMNPDVVYAYDGENAMWSFASGSITYAYCVLIQNGKVVKKWGANYNSDICAGYISGAGSAEKRLSGKNAAASARSRPFRPIRSRVRFSEGSFPSASYPRRRWR